MHGLMLGFAYAMDKNVLIAKAKEKKLTYLQQYESQVRCRNMFRNDRAWCAKLMTDLFNQWDNKAYATRYFNYITVEGAATAIPGLIATQKLTWKSIHVKMV
jgi:hypothetical protein